VHVARGVQSAKWLGYGLGVRRIAVRFLTWARYLSLPSKTSRPALAPTHPSTERVPGTLSPSVKRPGREAEQFLPSSSENKKDCRYTFIPHAPSWHAQGDNFTFTFLYKKVHTVKAQWERQNSPEFPLPNSLIRQLKSTYLLRHYITCVTSNSFFSSQEVFKSPSHFGPLFEPEDSLPRS